MAKVIVFGTGVGADLACRYLSQDSDHEICGFTTQKKFLNHDTFRGYPVVEFESVERKFSPDSYKMFIPLGFQEMNKLRFRLFSAAKEKGFTCISYVHSSIARVEALNIGENCFILENQSINLDVKIGNNVTLWTGNHIGDRTIIEDHVWLTSHVCIGGDAHIKPFCFLGMNATISNMVTLGESTFVGANALITRSTEDQSVYIVASTPKAKMTSDKFIKIANID